MANNENKSTTVVAGTLKVEGIIKNIEFTNESLEILFYINTNDRSSSIRVALPRPKKVVVDAIQSMGVKNLRGSLINLNSGTISVLNRNAKSDGATRAAAKENENTIPGVFI